MSVSILVVAVEPDIVVSTPASLTLMPFEIFLLRETLHHFIFRETRCGADPRTRSCLASPRTGGRLSR
jgi:hypothetical protein